MNDVVYIIAVVCLINVLNVVIFRPVASMRQTRQPPRLSFHISYFSSLKILSEISGFQKFWLGHQARLV